MRNQSPRTPSGGGQYNRGHSMESWLRDSRDEDLALFHDMRTRERKNFLHPSIDDFEASLPTKFGGLTGYRFPVSTPTRKGSNDLLAVDAEKNDYDWLLTPPGTPLFPSLDQDIPVTNDSQRSALSQPVSASKISRLSVSSSLEPSPKVLRGGRSPHRPSTASSTSSTNSTVRGRASSPSWVGSSPNLRPSTPSGPTGRASTTLSRPSARSSPPTLRRMNTSPIIRSSSTEKASSLKGRNRGNSLSPKLQAWQPPVLGLSSEPPPNLRTSISDRSVTTSRSATLSSRHGGTIEARNSYSEGADTSRSRWHSASSFGSSFSSSSYSQDRISSKGSVISSSDDGMEITQPALLRHITASPNGTFGDSKVSARLEDPLSGKYSQPAKRQIRSTSASVETPALLSVTAKKSLEPSMRQVDHRRISPYKFRPLLSSAPPSSFFNSVPTVLRHRPASPVQDSSITASSNASSEQGVRVVPGNESSDEDAEENESEWEKSLSPEATPNKIALDEDELTNAICIDSVHDSYAKHDYADHDKKNNDRFSGSKDVHPCRRADGCEINKVGIDMVADWTQHKAFTDRIWNSSRAEGDHERDNHPIGNQLPVDDFDYGSVDDDSTCFDSQRGVAISLHSEENADQLFVDIQEDLSVQSHSDKLLESVSNELHSSSLYFSQIPESETLQTSQTLNLTHTLKQETLKQETNLAEHELGIWSPQEQHGLLWSKVPKNDSKIKQKRLNNVGTDHLREELVYERRKNLSSSSSTIMSPSSTSYSIDEYDSHIQSDTVQSTVESQTLLRHFLSTVGLELPHASSLVETDKGASTVLDFSGVLNLPTEKRVDGPVTDAVPSGRENFVMTNVNSSPDYKVSSRAKRLVSSKGAADSSFLSCPNVADHARIPEKEEWTPYACNNFDVLVKKGHEEVRSSLQKDGSFYENQSDLASEESCREYFVDIPETTGNSESRVPETTRTSRAPRKLFFADSNPAVSLEKAMSMEERERPQASVGVDLEEEISEQNHEVVLLSSYPAESLDNTLSVKRGESPNAGIIADLKELSLEPNYKQRDASVASPVQSFLLDAADGKCGNNMAEDATPEVLSSHEMEEPRKPLDNITVIPSLCSEEILPSTGEFSEKMDQYELQFDDFKPDSSAVHSLHSISIQVDPQDAGSLTADIMDKSKNANNIPCDMASLEGFEQQPSSLDGQCGNCENSGLTPVTRTFTLEQATDTILFCSSIVHDIVYRAAAIATEKEGLVPPVIQSPIGEPVKSDFSDRILSRRELLKVGNWRGRPVQAHSAARRSLYQQNKEDILHESPAVTVQQGPLDEIKSGVMESHESLTHPVKTMHEKNKIKWEVNSKCACTIM